MNAYCISVPNQKIILILQRQGDDRILFGTMNKQKREYKQEPQTVLWNAAHGLYETRCREASGGPWNIGRYYEKMVD